MHMAVCDTLTWLLLAPLWKSAVPGLAPVAYSVVGYVSILAVFFVISRLTKMPLIGVFASFAGDVLIKIWLSIGVIILIASVFCTL